MGLSKLLGRRCSREQEVVHIYSMCSEVPIDSNAQIAFGSSVSAAGTAACAPPLNEAALLYILIGATVPYKSGKY